MRPLHAHSLSTFLVLALGICATAAPAYADDAEAKAVAPSEADDDDRRGPTDEPGSGMGRGEADAPGPGAHPEGEYGGVTPGKPRPTRDDGKPKKARQVAPRTLTWLGFQVQGGAPVVFVQLSSDITPEQSIDGKVLTLRFPGAKLDRSRNLARAVNTRFFQTDVVRIETKAVKKTKKGGDAGVVVRVIFKDAARQGQVNTQAADGGGQLVLISF